GCDSGGSKTDDERSHRQHPSRGRWQVGSAAGVPTGLPGRPAGAEGISERCPLRVSFHHEILLEDGIGARSASCAAHLFEAAAGLLKAIIAASIEPERVTSIRVTQVSNPQNPGVTG